MLLNTFVELLTRYRERLGMDQKTLALRCGLSPSHLNRIERGTRHAPAVQKVLAMAQALRLTPTESEEFVQRAGYSPLVLQGGLTYSAPSLSPVESVQPPSALFPISYARLFDALNRLSRTVARFPPDVEDQCITSICCVIDGFTALIDRPPASPARDNQTSTEPQSSPARLKHGPD